MKSIYVLSVIFIFSMYINAQDLSSGLPVNDMAAHPMQNIAKPAYLGTITDPSFGTTIRRITNAGAGNAIVPMYSTVQAWNADESMMIVYDQSHTVHKLLNGINYQFIRDMNDFWPADIEQIFWDFDDPDILYYLDSDDNHFIRYTVSSRTKETIVNLNDITGYGRDVSMGNDVQMMSWDSDVFTFRCGNDSTFFYRISTGQLKKFNIADVNYAAPAAAPSGNLFYHETNVYNSAGNLARSLNESEVNHACIGRLSNGHDAFFAVAFEEGPLGGCIGNIIAHDLTTGACFPVISESQGYPYPKSGTHISALAHKNTEGGWVAASMIGYAQNGQTLLDQELVIAKTDQGNIKVCRIGHHRSDEDQFDYWGEPHAVISPTGTRVLFGSDWSGSEDGQSLDCYVVELPSYQTSVGEHQTPERYLLSQNYPNPFNPSTTISFKLPSRIFVSLKIFDLLGREVASIISEEMPAGNYSRQWNAQNLPSGVYFYRLQAGNFKETKKLILIK